MSEATQQTNATTTSSPWSVQTPYLEQAFGGASNSLGTAQSNAGSSTYGAPNQFVAPYNPNQLSNFNAMIGYGSGNQSGAEAQSAAESYINPAESNTAGATAGFAGYNPFSTNNIAGATAAGNQYAANANIPGQVSAAMLPAEQAAEYGQLPQMARTAAASGNANSSTLNNNSALVQMGLGQEAAGIGANLEGQYFNTGANMYTGQQESNNANQLSAYNAEGQLGNAYGSTAENGLAAGIGDQNNLYTMAGEGGAGQQAANQAVNSNQLQAYNFGQSSPFTALDNFYNIIGSGQWGGTSNTNSNTTYTPSMLQTIGGVAGSLGSLMGGTGSLATGGTNAGWW